MAIGKSRASKPGPDAPSPPTAQPTGSGAVPGTEQAAEKTFGERLKASAAGDQVPGSYGYEPPELADDPNADAELAAAADEPMVVYQGEFGKREITAEQWREAGVEGMPTVLWERHTGFKVPLSVFSEAALQVLRQDQGFKVP